MSVLSYNQIIELFEVISEAHYQIKRFGAGELSEADLNKYISENSTYPVFWATPVSVQSNQNTINYAFNLLFFDIVKKDKNNEQEVLSDTLQIALDVFRILKLESSEFTIDGEPTISPFAGRYSEWVAGWSMELNIQVLFQDNLCDIPYEGLNLTQILQNFTGGNIGGFGCDDLGTCIDFINLENNVSVALGGTITGGTYSSATTTLNLFNTTGGTIQITGFTNGGGGTTFNCNDLLNCAVITTLTGDVQTLQTNVISLSGDVNTLESQILNAVSGASYSAGTLTLNTIGNNSVNINGFQNGDIFTTGGTYTSGNIIFQRNDGNSYSVTGLPNGSNSGGGGIPYFLNLSNSQTPYREFSPIPTNAAEQSTGVSINNGVTAIIAEFLTPVGFPNATVLPGGIWAFHLHSNKNTNNASFQIFAEVWKRTSGGTETFLFQTDSEDVLSTSPTINMQICDAYFSGTPLNVSDRLLVRVKATNTSNQTHTITLFTEGSQHYSYATTTFAVLGLTCETLSGCSTIQTIQTNVNNKYDKSGGTVTGNVIVNSPIVSTGEGLKSISQNTNTSIALYGVAGQGTNAYGVYCDVSPSDGAYSITNGIGGYFEVGAQLGNAAPTNSYSLQLKDGTEGVGKVLTSVTNDGKANWSNLPQDVFVTGGTFNGSQITITNNSGTSFNITGFTSTTGGITTWSNGSDGTLVSGTTSNSVTYTELISGGTFGNGDLVRINYRSRTTINASTTMRIYVNSTPNLSGSPILVGQYNNAGATSFLVNHMLRTLVVKNASNNTEVYFSAGLTPTDIGLYNSVSNLNINWANNQYIVFALQNIASLTQNARGSYYLIEKI